MIKTIKIGNVKVWFYLQQLLTYEGDMSNLLEVKKYVCYYKFSEPTPIIHGELLRDVNGQVRIFNSADEAIEAGIVHVKKAWSI